MQMGFMDTLHPPDSGDRHILLRLTQHTIAPHPCVPGIKANAGGLGYHNRWVLRGLDGRHSPASPHVSAHRFLLRSCLSVLSCRQIVGDCPGDSSAGASFRSYRPPRLPRARRCFRSSRPSHRHLGSNGQPPCRIRPRRSAVSVRTTGTPGARGRPPWRRPCVLQESQRCDGAFQRSPRPRGLPH